LFGLAVAPENAGKEYLGNPGLAAGHFLVIVDDGVLPIQLRVSM